MYYFNSDDKVNYVLKQYEEEEEAKIEEDNEGILIEKSNFWL